MSIYDLAKLEKKLTSNDTVLIHEPAMTSTIDIALDQSLRRVVILTDHQLNGRGRYGRIWEDSSHDILVTFIKPLAVESIPPIGSLLLSHLFAITTLKSLNGLFNVKIRWPNDLFFEDKKIGGILLSMGAQDEKHQNILFSVGMNLTPKKGKRFDASSFAEAQVKVDPTDLIANIDSNLDTALSDLSRFHIPEVYEKYNQLWTQNSALIGRKIQLSDDSRIMIGTVIESNIGDGLVLKKGEGSIIRLKEYGRDAHIKLL